MFAALAGYLRVDDPEQAPPARFARAAVEAEAALAGLVERVQGQLLRRHDLARTTLADVVLLVGSHGAHGLLLRQPGLEDIVGSFHAGSGKVLEGGLKNNLHMQWLQLH